ncbi:uncharacterized protein JCM6883_003363 [Sporobolomyces salmoneus]|uniref:uncharacterized protein n=1 Tax=Sporobolomyces salmoneus TaxID=183962 RepID=UPI00317B0BCC
MEWECSESWGFKSEGRQESTSHQNTSFGRHSTTQNPSSPSILRPSIPYSYPVTEDYVQVPPSPFTTPQSSSLHPSQIFPPSSHLPTPPASSSAYPFQPSLHSSTSYFFGAIDSSPSTNLPSPSFPLSSLVTSPSPYSSPYSAPQSPAGGHLAPTEYNPHLYDPYSVYSPVPFPPLVPGPPLSPVHPHESAAIPHYVYPPPVPALRSPIHEANLSRNFDFATPLPPLDSSQSSSFAGLVSSSTELQQNDTQHVGTWIEGYETAALSESNGKRDEKKPTRKRGGGLENSEDGTSKKKEKKRKVSNGNGTGNGKGKGRAYVATSEEARVVEDMKKKLREKLADINLSEVVPHSTASTSDSKSLFSTLLDDLSDPDPSSPNLGSSSPAVELIRRALSVMHDESPELVPSFKRHLLDVSALMRNETRGLASAGSLAKLDELDDILRGSIMEMLERVYPAEKQGWFKTIRQNLVPQARLLSSPILPVSFYPPNDWDITKKSQTAAPNWTIEQVNRSQGTRGNTQLFDQIPFKTPVDFAGTSAHPDTITSPFLRPTSDSDDDRGQQLVHRLTREYLKVLLEEKLLSPGISTVSGAQPKKAMEEVYRLLEKPEGVKVTRFSTSMQVGGFTNSHGSYPPGTAPVHFTVISLQDQVLHTVFEMAHYCYGKVSAKKGSGRRAYYDMVSLDATMDLFYLLKNDKLNESHRSSVFALTAAPRNRAAVTTDRDLSANYHNHAFFKDRSKLRRMEIDNGRNFQLDELDDIIVRHHVKQEDIPEDLPGDTSEFEGQSLLAYLCLCSARRGVQTRKKLNETRAQTGQLTSHQESAISLKKSNETRAQTGQLTSNQEGAISLRKLNETRAQNGQLTSNQEATISRRKLNETRAQNGQLTSNQQGALTRRMNALKGRPQESQFTSSAPLSDFPSQASNPNLPPSSSIPSPEISAPLALSISMSSSSTPPTSSVPPPWISTYSGSTPPTSSVPPPWIFNPVTAGCLADNIPSGTPVEGTPAQILARGGQPSERLSDLKRLQAKYGTRIDHYHFAWYSASDGSKKGKPARWIPISFDPKRAVSVREVVEEWEQGLDGQLSVKDLEGEWGTTWRAGDGGSAAIMGRGDNASIFGDDVQDCY